MTPMRFSACKTGAAAMTKKTVSTNLSNGWSKEFNLKIPFYTKDRGEYIAVQEIVCLVIIDLHM